MIKEILIIIGCWFLFAIISLEGQKKLKIGVWSK